MTTQRCGNDGYRDRKPNVAVCPSVTHSTQIYVYVCIYVLLVRNSDAVSRHLLHLATVPNTPYEMHPFFFFLMPLHLKENEKNILNSYIIYIYIYNMQTCKCCCHNDDINYPSEKPSRQNIFFSISFSSMFFLSDTLAIYSILVLLSKNK